MSRINYDGEEPRKCNNYLVCRKYGLTNYCYDCGTSDDDYGTRFGWHDLKFIIYDGEEVCTICNKHCNKKVEFPSNCGHSFCIDCSRNILFTDDISYHVSKVPHGCLSCPNGCDNPIVGKQCYCPEYDPIIDKWKEDNPDEYKDWEYEEFISVNVQFEVDGRSSDLGSSDIRSSGKIICPICKSEYQAP